MTRTLPALVLTAILAALAPAAAADTAAADRDHPGERIEEAARNLVEALKLLILTIPQYAAPEILPNGDIIIRRIHPGKEKNKDDEQPSAPPTTPGPEGTSRT